MKNRQHATRATVENQTMPSIARRSLIKATLVGTVAIPLAAQLLQSSQAADDSPPILDVNDPTAKALAYVEDAAKVDAKIFPAYKPGQKCTNCSQWQGEPADKLGGCELVLGQFVRGEGWCKVWEPKPAK
jgi:High potential iron-sulfur protein